MTRTPRRLGLLDVMILVASVALGLAWWRLQESRPPSGFGFNDFSDPRVIRAIGWTRHIQDQICPIAAMIPPGLVLITLRDRTRRRRNAFLRPGAAASLGVVIALGLLTVRTFLVASTEAILGFHTFSSSLCVWSWSDFEVLDRPVIVGTSVLASWCILLVTGELRCERSILDRLSRLIGVFWIVAIVITWIAGEY